MRSASLTFVRSLFLVLAVALVVIGAGFAYLRSHAEPARQSPGSISMAASPGPIPRSATVELAPDEPAETPAECARHLTILDSAPMTVERSASISTSVVLGTVTEVGPARWRTPDEKAPTERWEMTADNVVRLLRIAVDDDLAGTKTERVIVTRVPGGEIGCQTFDYQGYPLDIKSGDQFAFFLDAEQAPLKSFAEAAKVVEMWPTKGGEAVSSSEGTISISEIASRAAELVKSE